MKLLEFKIEPDEKEFHAWCPQLPGCHTHGKTIDSALKHLKEAVNLYIEDVMEETAIRAKEKFVRFH